MDSISGIGLEKYAELCAKMQDVFNDKEACVRIAKSEGIARDVWISAHAGWQDIITDPADMGKTAAMFVPLWQKAVDRINLNKRDKKIKN